VRFTALHATYGELLFLVDIEMLVRIYMTQKKLRDDAVTCRICANDGIDYSANSLISHITIVHDGMSLSEYEDQYGPGIAPSLRNVWKEKPSAKP